MEFTRGRCFVVRVFVSARAAHPQDDFHYEALQGGMGRIVQKCTDSSRGSAAHGACAGLLLRSGMGVCENVSESVRTSQID